MNLTIIIINLLALILLVVAFFKDKQKTIKSLKITFKSFLKMLPLLIVIIIIIGLTFGFLPSEKISSILGTQTGFLGVLITGLLGAILHIPAILAFPLSASILENGASITIVATFILTLTMVGIVTLPLEIKELGKKFALLRNVLSFVIAIFIAYIMGAIL
ncbi:MAG: permease [Candidatus Woesearchaeota archaeon]